jgi:hypothetical protein
MFHETEHLIKEMIETIGKIRQNRGTNSSSVKEQKRIILYFLRTKTISQGFASTTTSANF